LAIKISVYKFYKKKSGRARETLKTCGSVDTGNSVMVIEVFIFEDETTDPNTLIIIQTDRKRYGDESNGNE
jgi:riboflavin synthase